MRALAPPSAVPALSAARAACHSFLKSTVPFCAWSGATLERLTLGGTVMRLRRGEAMSQELAACVALVVSGVIEVHTVMEGHDAHAVGHRHPGSLLGLHGPFLPASVSGHGQSWGARSDAQLLRLPRALFMACFWEDPAMATSVLETLAQGINLLLDELACATLLDARGKVARRLMMLCASPDAAGGRAAQTARVSQADLGRMLGLSRQSINIALGELQEAGFVRVHRLQVEVLSAQGLRDQLEERRPRAVADATAV